MKTQTIIIGGVALIAVGVAGYFIYKAVTKQQQQAQQQNSQNATLQQTGLNILGSLGTGLANDLTSWLSGNNSND